MSTDRDVQRILKSWLHEDSYEDANHVLNRVLDSLDDVPQRRPWWPVRRFLAMTPTTRFAVATASLLVVAVIGISLFTGRNVASPSLPTPEPTPTATASEAAPQPWSLGNDFFVSATVDVSGSDWNQYYASDTQAGVISRSEDAWLWLTTGVQPYENPCGLPSPPLEVGPSVDNLIDALAAIPVNVSPVTETSVDGYPAQHMTFSAPAAREGCEDGEFRMWRWNNLYNHGVGPVGETRVWVVDVDGTRVLIVLEDRGTPQESAELEQMFDSIRLAPAGETG
jgi:hypothetical protein